MSEPNSRPRQALDRRLTLLALGAVVAVGGALWLVAGAPAQDLQSRLDQKQAQLDQAKSREGVLSTTIQRYGDQLDQLRGQVATLRNREAIVQAELDRKEAQLKRAKHRLEVLRVRLKRSLEVLRERLVAIYESSSPDTLTVILNSKGFDDLLSRYEYLRRVQSEDTSLAERVRGLKNQTKDTVVTVRAARNEIAAKQAELERTQAELQAAQEASPAPALPAGPVQGESSSGFIWPVNGPITSPFCEVRPWEACHPGIDIAVPSGTPIQAAASGTVAIAGPESGYGNYTCLDHGGGISTCYAHQASISVSVGQQVSQGQVIGISDCTGLCFGPHLHFEVRVNGTPVDPMGYLP